MNKIKNYTLLLGENYKLNLKINHIKRIAKLEFIISNIQIIISIDHPLYITDTLIFSLEAFLFKEPGRFKLISGLPLGKSFNRYSFSLGHLDNPSNLYDPSENYLIFGDHNCLFFYKKEQNFYFEVSTIYPQNNNLNIEESLFEIWLEKEFLSFANIAEFEDLEKLYYKLKLIDSSLKEEL
jgi:hypothetical protein